MAEPALKLVKDNPIMSAFQDAALRGDIFVMSELLGEGASILDVPAADQLPEETRKFLAKRRDYL